ncbi:NACHT, LRR and PYD domains-containing protein 4E isoform X1 [Asparagus officinalis]|nr:NACHT, LRR and PYD domains-containing protein 4E isoform X1 [Asparagus officinalis]
MAIEKMRHTNSIIPDGDVAISRPVDDFVDWRLQDLEKMETGSNIMQDALAMSRSGDGCVDWQQLYWEAHLQSCLDEAAERALLPTSDGHIGGVKISDEIMNYIGHSGNTTQDCLSYHCINFGHYARCLRLQNVLCVAEVCELLTSSKLRVLAFRRIKSKFHVDGVCRLLNQNKESLVSLEFIYCQLSPASWNHICNSVYVGGSEIHWIRHLCINSSFIFESKSSSFPGGLSSFLSSGRSLESLRFCDTQMGPKCAKIIFNTLIESSCGLVTLEISDDEIAGWLSKVDRSPVGFSLSLPPQISLKSLRVLNLRGNNLCKDDAEDLSNALNQMPDLRNMDISDNPIEDDGIRSLIPYFIKAFVKACPISDIKIENCNLSGVAVAELLRSLPTTREPLNSLSIAKNELGSSISAAIMEFLGTSRVRKLNIADIGLGALGFQELENGMQEKVEVAYINISMNRGGIRAAHFISQLISHAPNLVIVNAEANIMPAESLAIIHNALKQSKGKLQHLDLRENYSLCLSKYTAAILEFKFHGEPIVKIPLFPCFGVPYDDDP